MVNGWEHPPAPMPPTDLIAHVGEEVARAAGERLMQRYGRILGASVVQAFLGDTLLRWCLAMSRYTPEWWAALVAAEVEIDTRDHTGDEGMAIDFARRHPIALAPAEEGNG